MHSPSNYRKYNYQTIVGTQISLEFFALLPLAFILVLAFTLYRRLQAGTGRGLGNKERWLA